MLGVLLASSASAQRVFVAAQGSDANPCTFAAPCRTFQHAHDVVAAGGEIDVLDPAGYGALTITKPISIQGHGFSGISVASGFNGITIGTSSATDAVSLNGLIIEGSGVGLTGIAVSSGKSLAIENCIIRNMTASGVLYTANAGATPLSLSVSNSYFSDNGGSGINLAPQGSGTVTAAIERSAFYGNAGVGLAVSGAQGTGVVRVAATDDVAANGGTGFSVVSLAGHSTTSLALTRVAAAGNGTGLFANGPNTEMRVAQSTVTANASGYSIVFSGVILSYGDNYIDANGSNTGSLGSATKQ
jgi:hypothetical protein